MEVNSYETIIIMFLITLFILLPIVVAKIIYGEKRRK